MRPHMARHLPAGRSADQQLLRVSDDEDPMSTITGFGLSAFSYRSHLQGPGADQAIAQGPDAIDEASSVGATTSQASGGTAGLTSDLKIVTTGFTTAPKLSADVIDALLKDQAQQSAAATSTTNTTATTSPGASEETEPTAASSNSSSSDPASSKPQSVQDAASQLDPHHLTHQQEEQLIGDLVSSGKLSQTDGFRLFNQTVLADAFNSQHYRIVNGQFVATTPSPPGTIIGNDAPGGSQYDLVQRVQQSLAADQYFGDSANAAKDQRILDALNQLDSIRNGTTA